MDPDEILTRMRNLAEDNKCRDGGDNLIVLFLQLDNWLSTGGFAPDDWKDAPIKRMWMKRNETQ